MIRHKTVSRAVWEALDESKNRPHPHLEEFLRGIREGGDR